MYAIWHHFTEPIRRATSEHFATIRTGDTDDEDYCPLGYALMLDGVKLKSVQRKPDAYDLVDILLDRGLIGVGETTETMIDAMQFTNTYDDGRIADLADALGVER